MKKLLILSCMLPSILMAQTNGLSLAEVCAAVLSGNPSVRESLQRIVAADALLKQARSAYLPTISFKGSYMAIDSSLHPDIDPDDRYTDSFKKSYGGLQGTLPLFDGFARKARALGAKHNVQRTQELADETRRLLILSATVSFRQAQLAKENMRISEQDYSFNTQLEEDARKRFTAGSLPEADVQNFSIRALQAESSYLRSKLDYAISCTVLAELMALPEATLPEEMVRTAFSCATGSCRKGRHATAGSTCRRD
jgi:outer membrane protein TolC